MQSAAMRQSRLHQSAARVAPHPQHARREEQQHRQHRQEIEQAAFNFASIPAPFPGLFVAARVVYSSRNAASTPLVGRVRWQRS